MSHDPPDPLLSLLSLRLPSLTRLTIDIPGHNALPDPALARTLPLLQSLLHLDLRVPNWEGEEEGEGHPLEHGSPASPAASALLQSLMCSAAAMRALRRLSLVAVSLPGTAALRLLAASLPITHSCCAGSEGGSEGGSDSGGG